MDCLRFHFNPVKNAVNTLFADKEPWEIFVIACGSTYAVIKLKDFLSHDESLHTRFNKFVFKIARSFPSVKKKIQEEMDKAKVEIHDSVVGKATNFITKLPHSGLSYDDVLKKMKEYREQYDSEVWRDGYVSGTVYDGSDELTTLGSKVYEMFAWSNPLHPDVFPDLRQMEAEVVRMCCTMFHGDRDSCGTTTSGGTESLLLACHAYRNRAYAKGIKTPEIVASINVHAAFHKAASMFKMKLRLIPLDETTMKIDVKKMKRAINGSTCLLVTSAPEFPYGQIDPISEVAQLGQQYQVPVHVDCCLGGFLLPFMFDAGFPVVQFDFSLPGVTSISCDTHKYGFAGKGTSVILYRNSEYRKYQYTCTTDWRGGIYATPTIAGSRGGSMIAICWATMMHLGEKKYVESTRAIITTARYIKQKLREIEEITVIGDPLVSVVAFKCNTVGTFQVSSLLSKKGWHLTTLQRPPGIHIMVTKRHTQTGVADRLIGDVEECVNHLLANPDIPCDAKAKIYGMAQDIPDQSIVDDVATMYLDALYSTE